MWIHWPFFPKTWTKGHWPLDDLWPHVCFTCVTLPKDHCVQVPWEYINVCGYSDQFCKLPHTYIHYHIHTHTTYRMSDHIVSYWTQFRRDKKRNLVLVNKDAYQRETLTKWPVWLPLISPTGDKLTGTQLDNHPRNQGLLFDLLTPAIVVWKDLV